MALQKLLLQKRAAVVARWFELILASYPAETAKFLRKKSERFQNPVGETIQPALDELFVALVEGGNRDSIVPPLDRVIRIRAVQDFTPSEAVAFVFDLKRVVRDELRGQMTGAQEAELQSLDQRIEQAGLMAFDVYMGCREQLFEIRAKQIRNKTAAILRRHNYVIDDEDAGPGPEVDH